VVLGLPLDADGEVPAGPLALLSWETALGALAPAGFCLLHGAVFLALKTVGEVRQRATRFALRFAVPCLAPLALLVLVVQLRYGGGWTWVPVVLVLVAGLAAPARLAVGRDGQAFALLGVVIAAAVVVLFGSLYPNVLPST